MDWQCVGAFQVRRQSVGGNEQRERKQNTQCFHGVTLAFSKIYEIGSTPFLLSVFGLQNQADSNADKRRYQGLDESRARLIENASEGILICVHLRLSVAKLRVT